MARHCKRSLRGGSKKHSPCLGSPLATVLTTKQVLPFCLHQRALPRPTASTVLGQHAAGGLLLILSLSLLEPWEDRLVASDKFYQLHPTPYSLRLFSQYAAQLFASSFFPFPWSKWYEITWNSKMFFSIHCCSPRAVSGTPHLLPLSEHQRKEPGKLQQRRVRDTSDEVLSPDFI